MERDREARQVRPRSMLRCALEDERSRLREFAFRGNAFSGRGALIANLGGDRPESLNSGHFDRRLACSSYIIMAAMLMSGRSAVLGSVASPSRTSSIKLRAASNGSRTQMAATNRYYIALSIWVVGSTGRSSSPHYADKRFFACHVPTQMIEAVPCKRLLSTKVRLSNVPRGRRLMSAAVAMHAATLSDHM